MKTRLSCSGFSLPEVLCAIAVLGIGIVGLAQGLTTALRSTRESSEQTGASFYAAGVLETLRSEGGLRTGVTEDRCGESLPAARWRQTIRNTQLDGLFEVTVEVIREDTGATMTELRTLLFETPSTDADSSTRNPRTGAARQRQGGSR